MELERRVNVVVLVAVASLVAGCEQEPRPIDPEVYTGPSAPVEIIRDSTGVAHVFAATDADAFYGAGYAQAMDRLFQMDLVRRQALGRQAEVLGLEAADQDGMLRSLELDRWGRETAARMLEERPEAYALITAWTAGINARIDEVLAGEAPLPYGFGPDELDYEPERWETVDAFIIGKLIIFGNDGRLELELFTTLVDDNMPGLMESVALLQSLVDAYIVPESERPGSAGASPHLPSPPSRNEPRASPDRLQRALPQLFRLFDIAGSSGASNNWAVDGRHTASGRPLIAGDPHQPLLSPSRFYLQHICSAPACGGSGSFDVVGFAFVGSPGVQLGHNRQVAWTATTMGADVLDLWDVDVTGDTVQVAGEELEVLWRTEEVLVRGGEAEEAVVAEVPGYGYLLPDGVSPLPVVPPGHALLVNWTGFSATNEASSFFDFDRAGSIDEFEEAAAAMEGGSFNWIAADEGGIVYRNGMVVPDRGDPSTGPPAWRVLPGDDPETFWTGERLSPEQLPHSRADARGWLASANNDPFGFTADGDVSNDPWYFGAFFDPGTRAARISAELERLVERGDITVEDMTTLQLDSYSLLADELVPLIDDARQAVDTDEALAEFRDRPELERLMALVVDEWDRRMVRDSSGGLAFHACSSSAGRWDDAGFMFDAILGEKAIYMIKLALMAATGRGHGRRGAPAGPRPASRMRRASSLTDSAPSSTPGATSTAPISAPPGATGSTAHGCRPTAPTERSTACRPTSSMARARPNRWRPSRARSTAWWRGSTRTGCRGRSSAMFGATRPTRTARSSTTPSTAGSPATPSSCSSTATRLRATRSIASCSSPERLSTETQTQRRGAHLDGGHGAPGREVDHRDRVGAAVGDVGELGPSRDQSDRRRVGAYSDPRRLAPGDEIDQRQVIAVGVGHQRLAAVGGDAEADVAAADRCPPVHGPAPGVDLPEVVGDEAAHEDEATGRAHAQGEGALGGGHRPGALAGAGVEDGQVVRLLVGDHHLAAVGHHPQVAGAVADVDVMQRPPAHGVDHRDGVSVLVGHVGQSAVDREAAARGAVLHGDRGAGLERGGVDDRGVQAVAVGDQQGGAVGRQRRQHGLVAHRDLADHLVGRGVDDRDVVRAAADDVSSRRRRALLGHSSLPPRRHGSALRPWWHGRGDSPLASGDTSAILKGKGVGMTELITAEALSSCGFFEGLAGPDLEELARLGAERKPS